MQYLEKGPFHFIKCPPWLHRWALQVILSAVPQTWWFSVLHASHTLRFLYHPFNAVLHSFPRPMIYSHKKLAKFRLQKIYRPVHCSSYCFPIRVWNVDRRYFSSRQIFQFCKLKVELVCPFFRITYIPLCSNHSFEPHLRLWNISITTSYSFGILFWVFAIPFSQAYANWNPIRGPHKCLWAKKSRSSISLLPYSNTSSISMYVEVSIPLHG